MAKLLRGGCINADPWMRDRTDSACRFCDYAEACHFSEDRDEARYLPKLDPAAVWAKLDETITKGGGEP